MRYLISTICIALLLWGCDNSTAAPAKPKVVRKKIVAPKVKTAKVTTKKTVRNPKTQPTAKPQPKNVATKADNSQPQNAVARVDKPQTAEENQPPANQRTGNKILIAKNEDTNPVQNSQSNQVGPKKPTISPKSEITNIKQEVQRQTKPVGDSTAIQNQTNTSKPVTAAIMQSGDAPPMYDPKGKIDPFEPLFKEEPTIARKKKLIKRAPRTPLERIELSQLKLVGIILAQSGNRALVEESSGKGYVIKRGTYIGTNGGKIVDINKEIVTVEEKFEDVFGKIQTRTRELKLPKPPGEF